MTSVIYYCIGALQRSLCSLVQARVCYIYYYDVIHSGSKDISVEVGDL